MKIKLTFILILSSIILTAQDIKRSKKFFTTEYFRVSAIIGYDFSWAGDNGKTGLIKQNGNIDKENFYYESTPSNTIFLGLDAYDPTATLGFMAGVGINTKEYSIKSANGIVTDSIKTTNLEIPAYLRFRLGSIRSNQFWVALGGGYSINTKAEIIRTNKNNNIINNSSNKDQFTSFPFLSGIIGYEFNLGKKEDLEFNRDSFRIVLYGKANYDLGNNLDSKGFDTGSSLNSYTDPSIEFLRISLGIKILLRLTKAGELLNETLKQNLVK